jgi:1-acyl-sn-glycerol-3-phosphate acyltransferase
VLGHLSRSLKVAGPPWRDTGRAGARFSRGYAAPILYALVAWLLVPIAWWGRLEVVGSESVPRSGPLLLVPNHDSQWDPVLVALALRRRRGLRYLARANLWKIPGLGPILYAIGQIPIERGAGDAAALEEAVEALRAGAAICVFPEGRLSGGLRLRARSGVGRLAAWCPDARVVLCTVQGTADYVRFPSRPRVKVTLFEPSGGGPGAGEEPAAIAARLLDELRERVPPAPSGRRRRQA